jgi:folate-binding protein YgfZ
MIDLSSELSCVLIAGEDAANFLQGQTTNDVNALENDNWQFSAHLNHKGRILANFILYKADSNRYLLITHKSVTEAIIKRLKMFILRSKVEMSVIVSNIIFTSDNGELNPNNLTSEDILISFSDNKNLLITSRQVENTTKDTNLWHKYLIEQKNIFISSVLEGLFIPQHIEFQGISYTKGCYTGQEIVARTHYLGKSKRALHTINSSKIYEIGEEYIQDKISGIIIEKCYNIETSQYNYLISSSSTAI